MRTKVRISYPHTITGPAGDVDGFFRIDQSGTAELLPGEFLDRDEAINLCKRRDLRVTITDPPPPPRPARRRKKIWHG
jgi:hypothetical protein